MGFDTSASEILAGQTAAKTVKTLDQVFKHGMDPRTARH